MASSRSVQPPPGSPASNAAEQQPTVAPPVCLSRALFFGGLAAAATMAAAPVPGPFQRVEEHLGGRIGVWAIDTRTGRALEHRGRERFPLASTFKLPLVMLTLSRIEAGSEKLSRHIGYTAADILPHSPVTQAHLRDGFATVATLCAAAIEESDNGAGNLLLRAAGGPAAVTRFARAHGAAAFRLDDREPAVNGDDPRDSRNRTTPEAMARLILSLTRGHALSARSTAQLLAWMRATTTGDARLRAGVPAHWRVGDKTGSTDRVSNDVGILWPPNRTPIVVAAYCDAPAATADARDTALASCARLVAERLG